MPRHALIPVLTMLLAALVAPIAACGGGGGGGGGGGDEPPVDKGFRVVSTDPGNNELAVARDVEITATFSDEIDESTVHVDSFKVSQSYTGHPVAGTISFGTDGKTIRLAPQSLLTLNTEYRVLLTTEVQNRFGERLRKNYEGIFRTVVTDTEPPEPPPAEPKARLVMAGSMWTGRSSHTATLLASGAVLVAGGWASSTDLTASAELYDPSTRAFTNLTATLTEARANHTATLLEDGRVLITGGLVEKGNSVTDDCRLFDPGSQTFTATGSMTQPRCYHTATRLDDGRVLIAGGAQTNASSQLVSVRSAEVYDPQTGTFTAVPNMAVYRSDHRATLLTNGKVLITGGSSSSKVAELFDPTKDSFGATSSEMKIARAGHTATRMDGGTVLITGGGDRSGEIYNPTTSTFANTPGIPLTDRTAHTGDLVKGGRVLLLGGYAWTPAFVFHATVEYFNGPPGTKNFVFSDLLLTTPRAMHRTTVLANGDVLITGGANLDPQLPELATTELYTYTQQ